MLFLDKVKLLVVLMYTNMISFHITFMIFIDFVCTLQDD